MVSESPFLTFHYPEVDSTNRVARQLAQQTEIQWAYVSADRQTAGRGRYQRRWESPKNMGIWASLFCRPDIRPTQINLFGMALAVAIREFLEGLLGKPYGAQVRLKWPNDILINSKKCCGILLEGQVSQTKVGFVVAGFGVNVNQTLGDFPAELQNSAVSLKMVTGLQYEVAELRREIFEFIYRHMQQERENQFQNTVSHFRAHMTGLGEAALLSLPNREVRGICAGINELGFLELDTKEGREVINAGDLWILNRG
ncbi:MAG: hypothetical protein Kow0037_08710 [Calditrichia bacterium]